MQEEKQSPKDFGAPISIIRVNSFNTPFLKELNIQDYKVIGGKKEELPSRTENDKIVSSTHYTDCDSLELTIGKNTYIGPISAFTVVEEKSSNQNQPTYTFIVYDLIPQEKYVQLIKQIERNITKLDIREVNLLVRGKTQLSPDELNRLNVILAAEREQMLPSHASWGVINLCLSRSYEALEMFNRYKAKRYQSSANGKDINNMPYFNFSSVYSPKNVDVRNKNQVSSSNLFSSNITDDADSFNKASTKKLG